MIIIYQRKYLQGPMFKEQVKSTIRMEEDIIDRLWECLCHPKLVDYSCLNMGTPQFNDMILSVKRPP